MEKRTQTMDMNILKYMAFLKAVEYGSFTRAAEALNYSQSGVSRMIHDLEKEWNITLKVAKESLLFIACNPIGAQPGELVKVESATAPVLKAAAVLYVVPLLLFFLGYYLGTLPGSFGVLGGILGFCVGIALVVVYDRKGVKKTDFEYTITGYPDAFPGNAAGREEHPHG